MSRHRLEKVVGVRLTKGELEWIDACKGWHTRSDFVRGLVRAAAGCKRGDRRVNDLEDVNAAGVVNTGSAGGAS